MSTAPVFEIDSVAFKADPYPDLAAMRSGGGIHFVPQLNATLFTRRADIFVCEKNFEVFSSRQPGGLMDVLMGQNMMRKDGDALRDALLDGLARPHLLLVHGLARAGSRARLMTFWQAVRAVCQLRGGDGVFSCFEASAIVAAAVVFDDAPSGAAPSSATRWPT